MIYRIFHPAVHGRKRWGYYWRDDTGKRHVRFANPDTGELFARRADVESWVGHLRAERVVERHAVTFDEFARHLFDEAGQWAQLRRKQRGGSLTPATLYQHRLNVTNYILPRWKAVKLVEADERSLDEWLWSFEAGASMRRAVGQTMGIILKEAQRRGLIDRVPSMSMPGKPKGGRRGALTLPELPELFPRTEPELKAVWEWQGNHHEQSDTWLMLSACSALMFYGGLRPQEARAVHADQIRQDLGAVLITRSMDSQGRVNPYLKTGGERDPRYRLTLLCDRALWILGLWSARVQEGPLFVYDDRIMRKEFLNERVGHAIRQAGIKDEGRRFTAYSGRYTYVTTVKPFLDQAVLMALTGHTTEAMPERYDVPALVERAKQMQPVRATLNSTFG